MSPCFMFVWDSSSMLVPSGGGEFVKADLDRQQSPGTLTPFWSALKPHSQFPTQDSSLNSLKDRHKQDISSDFLKSLAIPPIRH
jgi:hypothetical protein